MEKVVFTNGCFDLIHPGHIDLLRKARALGTKLIVGINSDDSVRAIKGKTRPFLNQQARATILRELRSVDEVFIFEENTPERLVKEINPDVLVKGGDWTIEQIVGADFVLKNGGEVFSIPFAVDFSTSKIAEKIKSAQGGAETSEGKRKIETISIEDFFKANIEVFENIQREQSINISRCGEIIGEVSKKGKKIFVCGESEKTDYLRCWFAKFYSERKLTEKSSSGFLLVENAAGRLEESASEGDLLIALVTETEPSDVISAVMKAREIGCSTIALTGKRGVKLASLCDASVSVPAENEDTIDPAQIAVGCLWRKRLK